MPEAVTIDSIGTLHALLTSAEANAGELVIDLAATSVVDVTCLQLLCAAHHGASKAGRKLRLENIGPNVQDTLRQLGFIRHVGCNDDSTGSCLWVTRQSA